MILMLAALGLVGLADDTAVAGLRRGAEALDYGPEGF